MFGTRIKRYCDNCKNEVEIDTSVSYFVDGNTYYNRLFCPVCESDLAENDRKILKEAKENGKDIGVCMS
jgi:transcription initiation factor IIE alpha subunit